MQRHLLGGAPDASSATAISTAYKNIVIGMQRVHAETPSERQQADEEGRRLGDRMRAAYPIWLRNAVDDPLDEADIERIPEE